jgi:hypothetical protein
MSIFSTLKEIIRILLLFLVKGKNSIHTSNFWHRKATDLLEENRILRKELEDQKRSRAIADKVFLESRSKMDDLSYDLQLFEELLEERREELERREKLLCSCKRFPTKLASFEFVNYISGFDTNWEDDIPLDFKQAAFDCITQLLISKANSATIYIALDDLCIKTDSSNLECLKIVLDAVLSYLKAQSLLNNSETVFITYVAVVNLLQNF